MKTNKLMITAIAAFSLFLFSCGNGSTETNTHSHVEGDGHNHGSEEEIKDNSNRNEKGELVDAQGNLIMGCPGHKDLVGSKGDYCPKCGSMIMIPITWSIEGIDTVRVTTLADYDLSKREQI